MSDVVKAALQTKAKTLKQWINEQEPEMNFSTKDICFMLCEKPETCDKICSWVDLFVTRKFLDVEVAQAIAENLLSAKASPKTEELKQKLEDFIKTCPLVPNTTYLSMKECDALLADHSIELDEWYHKLKELVRVLFSEGFSSQEKSSVEVKQKLQTFIDKLKQESPYSLSFIDVWENTTNRKDIVQRNLAYQIAYDRGVLDGLRKLEELLKP